MGDVVADDHDLVDRRDAPLLDVPREVDHARAVGQDAPGLLRHDLRVDVAAVRVQVAEAPGRGIPRGAIERPARAAGERIERHQLIGRVAAVAADLEGADLVRGPFVDGQLERRLAFGAVGDQRVTDHLEIDVATARIPAGEPLANVVFDAPFVVLAAAEPPERFRLAAHLPYDVGIGELLVAFDRDAAQRDPPSLAHVEEDAHAARGVGGQLDRGHLRRVVPPLAVEGIDGARGAGERGTVQRAPFEELHAIAHVRGREFLHAADRPAGEKRTLLDDEGEDAAPAGNLLRHRHIVELARTVERRDRALDVAVVDRRAGRDGYRGENLLRSDARVALHRDAVHPRGDRILGAQGRRQASQGGENERSGNAHAHGVGREG